MISLRLCWPVLAVWYMCQGTIAHLGSTQVSGRKFETVKGVRYESRDETTYTARSIGECALICVNDKSCSNFNFISDQCELLSEAAFCRPDAAGWTHGYYPIGKYQTSCQQVSLSKFTAKQNRYPRVTILGSHAYGCLFQCKLVVQKLTFVWRF